MEVCKSRRPDICRVTYHEYATTTARVMANPSSNPAVAERGLGNDCATLPTCNGDVVGSQIQASCAVGGYDHLKRLQRAEVFLPFRGNLSHLFSAEVVDINGDGIRVLFLPDCVSSGVQTLRANGESGLRQQHTCVLFLICRAISSRVDQTREQNFPIRELDENCVALLRRHVLAVDKNGCGKQLLQTLIRHENCPLAVCILRRGNSEQNCDVNDDSFRLLHLLHLSNETADRTCRCMSLNKSDQQYLVVLDYEHDTTKTLWYGWM